MTDLERQALREKHTPLDYGDGSPPQCLGCDDNCIEGDGIDWPCDVIKVLDATENLKFNDLKVEVKCDHNLGLHLIPLNPEKPVYLPYCPFCGEKRRHYD